MSTVHEEIERLYASAILGIDISNGNDLTHYGMPRRSGRYPWGSGEDPYQHGTDFLGRVEELRKSNFTYTDEKGKTWTGDTAIAKSIGLTTSQFRTEIALATTERRMLNVARAKSLREDGLSNSEIGREMGVNESTVRSWFEEKSETNMKKAQGTADFLREQVDKKGMVDIGTGVERELGISKEKLNQAVYMLEREGYVTYLGGIPQATNAGKQINQRVLCKPGTEHKEIYEYDRVHSLMDYTSRDGGESFRKFEYPASLDSKRLQIRYADDIGPDGAKGIDKDGIIELRRGVKDLSLGNDHYSQVRILVDNDKYLKGMAVYSDNLPDGVDVVFNTNKTRDKSMAEVLKGIKEDPDNPFGSLIKPNGQSYYDDPNGKYTDPVTGKKQSLSLINKRAAEGDWSEWKDALPSQFLGKQSKQMAQQQLDLAKANKLAEYDEIRKLDNPTIKKHLLEKFADECDSAAVNLQAAALPGQKYHVIIPINTLKDNEIYAPQYDNGTKLALIRYPHGGTFEIPILTVNNRHKPAEQIIGKQSIDAVGITKANADRLSGADFDGDTVMCIPTHDAGGKVKVSTRPGLKGLEGFDPKDAYPAVPGMKYMKDPVTGKDSTQMEMGKISNLITDMTLGGASEDELARAVRHSMVVIDAGKHKLNYRQSYIDNNIEELKRTYQIGVDKNGNIKYGGASTILSKSKGQETVERRQGNAHINHPDDELYDPSKPIGSLVYKKADDLYYPIQKYDKATKTKTVTTVDGKKISYRVDDKDARAKYEPTPVYDPNDPKGKRIIDYTSPDGSIHYKLDTRTQKSTKMAETDDAYTLVSKLRHPMELIYADYANSMKSLANEARKELMVTGKIAYNKEAAKEYKAEVASLNSKTNTALLNATRERAAQRQANYEVQQKQLADPNMKKSDIKKASQQALSAARQSVGSIARRDRTIDITDREWEAIQKGAISETKLKQILNNTDIDKLRARATPRATNTASTAQINKIKAMSASNYTLTEIAKATGLSTTTISKYLKGED